MDNATLQKIKDALAKSNNIGIVVGQNPSLDQMAAALALHLTLRKVNKKSVVASPTDPIVEISSLVGIDKVQTSLGGDAGDLVVSFPYVEGDIEKVSYTLENDFLNIIVKAGENGLSFEESDVKYTRGSGSIDLLFVVGTPRLADLGELLGGDKLRDAKIINIDNNSENQGFGDIVLVSPQASSLSEHVGDLLLTLGFQIDQDSAQNMLSGIISATHDFQDPRSSSLAFEIAGLMMQRGAKRVREVADSSFMPRAKAPQQVQPQPQSQPQSQPLSQPQVQAHAPQTIEPTATPTIQRLQEEPLPEALLSPKAPQYQPEAPVAQAAQDGDKAPIDWLSPKVYKGSTNV